MKEKKYSTSKTERDYSQMVKYMFSRISGRYDLMNRLLSFGRDINWRRKSLEILCSGEPKRFLDVACGTGDLGILAVDFYPGVKVFGIDFSEKMLSLAVRKVKKGGISDKVTFIAGDALFLPFREGTFDITAVAFGLRNVPNREKALMEMLRVTKKGGKIMVLEMSMKRDVGIIYRAYFRYLTPIIAKIFSEDSDAYLYLIDTVTSFPDSEELKWEMEKIGLHSVTIHRFWPGITYLIIGYKP